jgi:hypothetical protein
MPIRPTGLASPPAEDLLLPTRVLRPIKRGLRDWGGRLVRRCGVVVAIAALVAVIFGSLVGGSLVHETVAATVGRTLIGAVGLVIISLLVLKTGDMKSPPGVGRPIPIAPSKREVWQAYVHCVETYDTATLGLLVKMLINLPQYLERINEDVSPQEEVPELDIATHQVYRVGTIRQDEEHGEKGQDEDHGEKESLFSPQTLLVPLVLAEKGTLLDGFEVSDSSDCEVPTLSYNQTRGLLAYAIETIINIAPRDTKGMSKAECEKNISHARSCLTSVVCAPGPRKKQSPEKQKEVSDWLKSIDGLPTSQDWKKRITDFCETLADYYVIIAETNIPTGVYLSLKYKQRVPVERSSLNAVNRVRSRFGLRFSAIDIPLNLFALGVEAYHLQMNATPMQYVYDHHLEWLGDASRKRLVQSDLHNGDFKPYVRLHYNTAQPAMHLYIRRQFDPSARPGVTIKSGFSERLKSVVEFREIPPGTLGAATVVAAITAIIISFFAVTQIGQDPSTGVTTTPTVSSDIPALLLALPGVASLVIGSWLDLSRLRQASLATYLGLGVSAVLSLASALYFLLNAYRVVPGHLTLWISAHVAIKTDVGWLVLAGVAITSCLFLCRDLAATSRYYFQRVKARVATAGLG